MSDKLNSLLKSLSQDKFRSSLVVDDAELYGGCLREVGATDDIEVCNSWGEERGSNLFYLLQYQILELHQRIKQLEEDK